MVHDRQIASDSDRRSSGRGLDRAIADLAAGQHGVVARRQLVGLGLGLTAIDRRVAGGRLHVIHRGVYAVGHAVLTREARWMAAVLAGGHGAVLSRRSAGALWGLTRGVGPIASVSTPRRQHPLEGIRFHWASMAADEVTVHHGIPVTTPTRTLLDLAAASTPRDLERALNEADVLRLWGTLSLEDLLARYPRRRGVRTLRAALAARQAGATITRSQLEEAFLGLVDELDLPRPELNVSLVLEGEVVEVDALWRAERVVVELDGRRFHDTPTAFERDRRRDRRLTVHGLRPVRVTWRQLERSRRELADDLRRLVPRQRLTPRYRLRRALAA